MNLLLIGTFIHFLPAHNNSPRQLWHSGMSQLLHLDPDRLDDMLINSWDEYGIDEEAPQPNIDSDNNVVPPESRLTLNVQQLHNLTRKEMTTMKA